MKKIFSLSATALVALFGLTCCGGGGGSSSDPDIMTIQDFANASKMYTFYNKVTMYVSPVQKQGNSEVTEETTSVIVKSNIIAGEVETAADCTYARDSESQYRLTYSFESTNDLDERDLIAGFGFTPPAETGETEVPNAVVSLLQYDLTTLIDVEAGTARTSGECDVVVDPDHPTVLERKMTIGKNASYLVTPNVSM